MIRRKLEQKSTLKKSKKFSTIFHNHPESKHRNHQVAHLLVEANPDHAVALDQCIVDRHRGREVALEPERHVHAHTPALDHIHVPVHRHGHAVALDQRIADLHRGREVALEPERHVHAHAPVLDQIHVLVHGHAVAPDLAVDTKVKAYLEVAADRVVRDHVRAADGAVEVYRVEVEVEVAPDTKEADPGHARDPAAEKPARADQEVVVEVDRQRFAKGALLY